MKKIIIASFFAVLALNISAQKIEKGIWQIEIGTGIGGHFNWVTGGEFDYDYKIDGKSEPNYPISGDWKDFYNSETDLGYDLDFTNFSNWESRFLNDISFGYFLADGFLLGLGLDLGGYDIDTDSDTLTALSVHYNDSVGIQSDDEFNVGVKPKLRYYITTGRGNAVFFEASYRLGVNNSREYYEDVNSNSVEISKNTFGSSAGLGFGWSIFNFSSREIFAIEPMIGFNFNNIRTNEITTVYNDLANQTTEISLDEKKQSMGPYFKLKLAFYLGRHFWSH
ncbi:MAG: hypothetical protein CMD16_01540 [Flavobacteriales bacterium]|nr:hypothetical protein [Flavobacteriales bacterium]|tara:strand:- start:2185 stop:3024 length:840 start_codon:yes stop_codon:yes gene_type:complete